MLGSRENQEVQGSTLPGSKEACQQNLDADDSGSDSKESSESMESPRAQDSSEDSHSTS